MANYEARLDRIEAALMPMAGRLPLLFINYDETKEQAAARYIERHGLPPSDLQRILRDGIFVRFASEADIRL